MHKYKCGGEEVVHGIESGGAGKLQRFLVRVHWPLQDQMGRCPILPSRVRRTSKHNFSLSISLILHRMLFAQDKQARKLYRRLDPFAGIPLDGRDHLLSSLCGRKTFHTPVLSRDQDSYDLQCQFPILRSRIAALHRLLSTSKPRGWRELWRDKRDSAGWFTFWIVLIFGGVAILLSALQVLLQILQMAMKH